jgi:hypothetical protein
VADHHSVKALQGGVWTVARPLRAGWWTQRKAERACRETTGHCWHACGYVDWWCCMCSGETDGMPAQRCVHCLAAKPQECQGADFSKLLAHLSDNLVEHAKHDDLNPVRAAVLLDRGGHAPGEACPTAGPIEPDHASSCSWLLGDDCDCGAIHD